MAKAKSTKKSAAPKRTTVSFKVCDGKGKKRCRIVSFKARAKKR